MNLLKIFLLLNLILFLFSCGTAKKAFTNQKKNSSDEFIGLKSTSIKFKGKEKKFLISCYIILLTLLIIGGNYMELYYGYYFLMLVPFAHLFLYQIRIFDSKNPSSCLKAFKSNNFFGFIIFLNLLLGKLLI